VTRSTASGNLVALCDFAAGQFGEQLSPDVLRKTAINELTALLPVLRRLPRRLDRIGGALETGRLSVNVRVLADAADRRYFTGMLHQVILTALAATAGIMAVIMLGLHGGPSITRTVTLYAFFGYCLLVIAAILALRCWSPCSVSAPDDTRDS
jgi:ubiquinone biosynthesis protein